MKMVAAAVRRTVLVQVQCDLPLVGAVLDVLREEVVLVGMELRLLLLRMMMVVDRFVFL